MIYRASQELLLVDYLDDKVAFYSPDSLALLNSALLSSSQNQSYMVSAMTLKDKNLIYVSHENGEISIIDLYSHRKKSSLRIDAGLNVMK